MDSIQFQVIGDYKIFDSKNEAYQRCLQLGVGRNQVLMIYPKQMTQKLIHTLRKYNHTCFSDKKGDDVQL